MVALNQQKNLQKWFSEFRIQTRLLAAAALIISLMLASFTFWALNYIQEDARRSDQRFGEAVGNLLGTTAAPLISRKDYERLQAFTQEFQASNSDNILYVLYADPKGDILYGSPFNLSTDVKSRPPVPALLSHIEIPEILPGKRQHRTPKGLVTDIFVPINYGDRRIGVVLVGINPEANLVSRSELQRDVAIAVFVLVWIIAILGAVFNALTITQPLKELVTGVQRIAQGNFRQRITLSYPGELGSLIASFNLMAERLQSYAEQNIEEMTTEKAKLETFVATIADGAILLDSSLRIVLVNPAALRILRWEERVVGMSILDLLPVGLRAEVEEPLDSVARGILDQAECRIIVERRTLRVLISSVVAPRGDGLKDVVLTVQDLSKEAELNLAKSQFISNVSHELRTPLSSIKSFIETLYDCGDGLDEATKREFLEITIHETDRLTRLVNDVLDLSRLESGREYHFEPVDIVQPMEQTLRTHQLTARERDIDLVRDVAADLPLVWGNYDLLQQVFANLVGNALKFTEPGGTVTIRAQWSPDAPRVRVGVSDTGIGISPEEQQRIFDRFYRVENKVHTLEGTGLGLSIVSNIVEKHRARIHIDSAVGQGTTFWFDLEAYLETCDLPQKTAEPVAGLAPPL